MHLDSNIVCYVNSCGYFQESSGSVDVASQYSNLLQNMEFISNTVSKHHHEYISSVSRRLVIFPFCSHLQDEDIDKLCSAFVLIISCCYLQNITLSLAVEEVHEKFNFSLSSDQIREVDSVLKDGDESQLYSTNGGYNIYLRDLRTLQDRRWLNDNVSFFVCFDYRLLIFVYNQQRNWLQNV